MKTMIFYQISSEIFVIRRVKNSIRAKISIAEVTQTWTDETGLLIQLSIASRGDDLHLGKGIGHGLYSYTSHNLLSCEIEEGVRG